MGGFGGLTESSRFQGFEVSEVSEVSRFQSFKVSESQGFRVSRFQSLKVSEFQGFGVSRFRSFKVSEFQGFEEDTLWVPRCASLLHRRGTKKEIPLT